MVALDDGKPRLRWSLVVRLEQSFVRREKRNLGYADRFRPCRRYDAGTAILFACLGEILCERAGVLNLGVEGMMLMGCAGRFCGHVLDQKPMVGRTRRRATGGAMSLIHALLTVRLQANQVVSGLALTLFGGGLSPFLGQKLVGLPAPASFNRVAVPFLSDIPNHR